jgi:hypothetical protein
VFFLLVLDGIDDAMIERAGPGDPMVRLCGESGEGF